MEENVLFCTRFQTILNAVGTTTKCFFVCAISILMLNIKVVAQPCAAEVISKTSELASQFSETHFLDRHRERQATSVDAMYIRTVELDADKIYHVTVKTISSGTVVMTGTYLDAELTIEEGQFHYFFANGEKESTGVYEDGVKVGVWKRWDWTGVSKPDRIYPRRTAVL